MDLFGRKRKRLMDAGLNLQFALVNSFKEVYKKTYGSDPSENERAAFQKAILPFTIGRAVESTDNHQYDLFWSKRLEEGIDDFAEAASNDRGKIALLMGFIGEIVFSETMGIRPGYEWSLVVLNKKTSQYLG